MPSQIVTFAVTSGLGGEVDGECEFVGTTVAVGVVNLPRDVGAVNLYRREGERLPQNIPFTGSVTPTALRGAAEGLATVTSIVSRRMKPPRMLPL